jgi:hypothetical protein
VREPEEGKSVIEYGCLGDGDAEFMTKAALQMLADLPEHLLTAPLLILPAAQTPFPWIFSQRMKPHPLIIADPRQENLDWQRVRVSNALYVLGGSADLADLEHIGIVLNPLGLQHYPSEIPHYASRIRRWCRPHAIFMTLDWGHHRYPEILAQIPGIEHDIRHAAQRVLPPYGTETGWKLLQETELRFEYAFTIEALVKMLRKEDAARVRTAFSQDQPIIVGSSACYRRYEAI